MLRWYQEYPGPYQQDTVWQLQLQMKQKWTHTKVNTFTRKQKKSNKPISYLECDSLYSSSTFLKEFDAELMNALNWLLNSSYFQTP